ncbi:MAG: biliverdin-producing heme oxygenase [Burkholderiaceae bacterium]
MPEGLSRLRKATRSIHERVERFTESDRLLEGPVNLPHYQQFLSAHYLLHKQVAHHCAQASRQTHSTLLDWPDCPRLEALSADLERLSISIDPSHYSSSPAQSLRFSLGLVYVCEGSCIGNKRVLAALNRHEQFHAWNCSAYLSSCHVGFAERWKTLLQSIESLTMKGAELDAIGYKEIERGAITGFELYLDYWRALSHTPNHHQRQVEPG